MTKKDIHLSLLPKYKIQVTKFLNDNKLKKQLIYNDDVIEVVISDDAKNTQYIEEVCEEITVLIINIMKDKVLKEYILKNYSDVYEYDSNEIYTYSLEIFNQKEPFIKDTILTRVYNYILNNDHLNIDGFVKFRIKEFMKYIPVIGDIALEEYLIRKDQDEFINVLKYFIDIQEEKIDLLRVHITSENYFILYDKYGNRIENIDDEEIVNMVIKENLNYEDFLISTLLTLCPKRIEILDSMNNNSSKEIIDTIKSIFVGKVSIILQN